MHFRGSAKSNLQKLARACGQLLKATPDHSAPLIKLRKESYTAQAGVRSLQTHTPAAGAAGRQPTLAWLLDPLANF